MADIHADIKLIEQIYQIKDNEEVNGDEVINGTCPVIHQRFKINVTDAKSHVMIENEMMGNESLCTLYIFRLV